MSMGDIFVVVGILFGFMLAALFSYAIYSGFSTQFKTVSPFMNTTMTALDAQVNKAITAGDVFFPTLFIIVGLIGVASAANISAHPAFFFVMIFVNVAVVICVEVFKDIFAAVSAAPGITPGILTWTPVFITYIPKISVALMLLTAIAMYAKNVYRG
jgi:hypothetical protein